MNAHTRTPGHSPRGTKIIALIDRITPVIDVISTWSGKTAAWLIVPMFAVLFFEVAIRKLDRPTIWANDIATMCYGAHFFLCAAYTLQLQKHIRTDFFSKNWSLKTQVRMDIAQYLLLFLPGMVVFTWASWEFAAESWDLKEALMTTWRPPAYWYKTVIPVSSILILLQGMAEVLKCVKTLYTGVDYRADTGPSELT
jgi:TRAP-type mannitol/chloroaromatic compound transport system permease small subunit